MISVDLIPEALQKIEFQIQTKQAELTKNMAQQWDLQKAEDRLRHEIEDLENNKYRLLSGRNI